MKKIKDWAPWVKMVVGFGAFALSGVVMFLPLLGSPPDEATLSPLFHIASLFGMAGLILLFWGLGQWVADHRRIKGVLLFATGLILTTVTIVNLPGLWEWSKGGVVNFIPAPLLVPLVPALPALLIFYGFAEMRRK